MVCDTGKVIVCRMDYVTRRAKKQTSMVEGKLLIVHPLSTLSGKKDNAKGHTDIPAARSSLIPVPFNLFTYLYNLYICLSSVASLERSMYVCMYKRNKCA